MLFCSLPPPSANNLHPFPCSAVSNTAKWLKFKPLSSKAAEIARKKQRTEIKERKKEKIQRNERYFATLPEDLRTFDCRVPNISSYLN